jgi:hypothetical protein
MKLLMFVLLGSVASFGQINERLDRGSLHATVTTEYGDEWGPILVIAANSDNPVVVSFEITVNFVVDGGNYSRTAIAQRAVNNKLKWVRQEFYFPHFAEIVSVNILERPDLQTITIKKYMTSGDPPFRQPAADPKLADKAVRH